MTKQTEITELKEALEWWGELIPLLTPSEKSTHLANLYKAAQAHLELLPLLEELFEARGDSIGFRNIIGANKIVGKIQKIVEGE